MPDRCEFLTVREVMALLRLGRTTVYAQARLYLATGGTEGIPCRRFGRSLRFPSDELARFADCPALTSVSKAAGQQTPVEADPAPAPVRRVPKRTRPSSPSPSPRTASAPSDDTVVQPALPFTD